MGPGLESRKEIAAGTVEANLPAEKVEPLDDSGERLDGPELPDDSGDDLDGPTLPDDTGENMPEEKLTPEEIARKQDRVIQSVENGEISLEPGENEDTKKKNAEKGNYGEMKIDQDLRRKGYQRISLDTITALDDKGHRGIDGVYFNPDGKPPYLIVDAKYNRSPLSDTKQDGMQMSQTWIDKRLDASVGKEKADEIRLAQLSGDVGCYVGHVAKGPQGEDLRAPVSYDRVDDNGKIVEEDVKINAA